MTHIYKVIVAAVGAVFLMTAANVADGEAGPGKKAAEAPRSAPDLRTRAAAELVADLKSDDAPRGSGRRRSCFAGAKMCWRN
jgi:hypothetical protein